MQRHKALLPFTEKQVFLAKIIAEFRQFGCKPTVVINQKVAQFIETKHTNLLKQASFIYNFFPEKGRLFSIQLAINQLVSCQHTFIHNVDNPFVNQHILGELYRQADRADCTIPAYGEKGGHPVLVSRKVMAHLRTCSPEQSLRTVLANFSQQRVPFETDHCTRNINTPDEYRKFFDFIISQ